MNLRFYLLPVLALILICPFSLYAQITLEEIQVTAQMREQSADEIPSSISVFTQSDIQKLQVDELIDLAAVTPGVTAQAQSVSIPTIVIRGISSDEGAAQDSPRVALFLNDADISRNRGSLYELYDIAHVEIVRGANSALQGNSSAVGSIRAITAKPEQNNSGKLSLSAGNYGSFQVQGFGNFYTDNARARLAFFSNENRGYVDDLSSNQNLMAIDRQSLRPSLSLDLSEALELNFVATFERANDSGVAYKSGTIRPNGGDLGRHTALEHTQNPLANDIFRNGTTGIDRDTEDYNLQIIWDIDSHTKLSAISHYRTFDSYEAADLDGSAAWALHIAESVQGDKWSQEVRLNYEREKYSVVAGLLYTEEDGQQNLLTSTEEGTFFLCAPLARQFLPLLDPSNNLNLTQIPCQNPDGSINSLTPTFSTQLFNTPIQQIPYIVDFTNFGATDRWSAYIDSSIEVSDRFTLHTGVRYINSSQLSGFEASVPNSAIINLPLILIADTAGQRISAEGKDSALLPRIAINWQLNDYHQIYASWAKGQKPSITSVFTGLSSNLQPLNPVRQIDAERLTNTEFGFKGQSHEQKWKYAVSLFHQRYKDFQIDQINMAAQLEITNAGDATNLGVEIEGSYQLTDNWQISATLARIDAEIDNGSFEGQRFRLQPERTFSFSTFYERDLNQQYRFTSNLSYSYQSAVFFDDASQPDEPFTGLALTQDGYGVANINVGIHEKQRGWSLSFWTTNLLDEEYLIDAGNGGVGFGLPTFITAAPRMHGVRFIVDF